MASSVCCPPGSWGAASPPEGYVNKGKKEALGANLNGYVVRPSSGKKSNKAVIACMDIFGENSGRTKAICDDLAEKLDCLVVLPNFLENDEWKESWGMPNKPVYNLLWFIPWCIRHNGNKTLALYESDLKPFFAKEGIDSFGMISFCWGALCAEALCTLPGAKAHAGCHPSHGAYPISFGKSMPQTLSEVKCPQLWLAAHHDQVKPGDEGVLAVTNGAKQPCQVVVYENQVHGWINRGDVKRPEVLADVEKALNSICDFLMTNLIGK